MVQHPVTFKGMTVVEVLIGVALFLIIVVFIAQSLGLFFANATLVRERTKAVYLASEAQEMVRYVRDEDWNAISSRTLGTAYSLNITPGSIVLSTAPEVVDTTYTRSIVFTSVYRNATDDIVASTAPGAVLDTGCRYVTVTVGWGGGEVVTLQTLVTNIFDI
jgi:type II secretory pathway pseudopilin PulG